MLEKIAIESAWEMVAKGTKDTLLWYFYLLKDLEVIELQTCLTEITFISSYQRFQVKVKLSRYTPRWHVGSEEVYLLLFLVLGTRREWGIGSTPWPPFIPGEPRVPIVQEAGWAPEPVWTQRQEEKSSAHVGDRTPALQSVASHYTDWATRLSFRSFRHRNFYLEKNT
jgi:hypothetical protein